MDARDKRGHDDTGENSEERRRFHVAPSRTGQAWAWALQMARRRDTRSAMRGGWVYIMTNRPNGTLYLGVTSDLSRRAYEHREGLFLGFTKRYGLKRLVFAERHEDIGAAIQREKTMKHWPRAWKIRLIVGQNPNWDDLYDQIV